MFKLNASSLALPVFLLLAACAGNPGAEVGSVEQSVSRQTATTEVRQRAKVHTELGALYLQDGRQEVALEEARAALDAESGYAPAHNLMGLIYMTLHKHELAEQSFRRALQLASADPEINNNYAWFLCQTGKVKESFAYFNAALSNPLYSTPAKALVNAGLCALIDKNDQQAEAYLNRVIRIDRNNPTAMFWLADIGYRGKRLADARQWLRSLHAQIEPTPESAWLGLRIERKLGDREAEARYTGILRRKYRDTPEYLKLSRGEYE